MADTPSSGSGVDIASLGIQVDATQPVQAASALDSMAKSADGAITSIDNLAVASKAAAASVGESVANTTRAVASTEELTVSYGRKNKAVLDGNEVMAQANVVIKNRIQLLQEEWAAEQAAIMAIAKASQALDQEAEARQRFLIKLEDTVRTYNLSTEALLRYRAAELGAAEAAEPLIVQLEAMRVASEKYGVAVTEVGQIEQARMEWESRNRAALDMQRTRSLSEQVEQERLAQEEMIKNQTIFQAFRTRTMMENRAEAMRILTEQEQAAIGLAEKQAIEEIRWGEMSVKARIAQLERLKAFQANSAIRPETIEGMFSSAAFKDLPNLSKYINEYNESLKETTKSHSAAHAPATSFADGLSKISFESSRARSEVVVLAHEFTQGRFSKMPGSLMVLMEYTNAASLAFTGMGIATLGAAAAIGFTVYEMIKGSAELTKFNNSMLLTGNYAGLTRDSFEELAQTLKGEAHGAIGTASDMLMALASSGKVSSDVIESMGATALRFQALSGQSTEQVARFFEGLGKTHGKVFNDMQNDVAEWAAKANDQYHFLSAAQYEHIRLLTLQGDKQQAIKEMMELFNDSMHRHEERIGILTASYRGWAMMLQGVAHWMQEIGKGWFNKTSLEDDMVTKQKQYEDLAKARFDLVNQKLPNGQSRIGAAPLADLDAKVKAAKAEYTAAAKAYKDSITSAQDEAAMALANSEGVEAQRHIDYLKKVSMGQDAIADDMVAHAVDAAAKINRNNMLKWEQSYKGDKDGMQAAEELAIKSGEIQVVGEKELSDLIIDIRKKHHARAAKVEDDGRKQRLLDQLGADQQEYKQAEEATSQDVKMLKAWADQKQITRQTEYDSVTASFQRQLAALDDMKRKETETLEKYKPKNTKDAEETQKRINEVTRAYQLAKQQINDAMEKTQQDIVGAAGQDEDKDGSKELNAINSKIDEQKKFNAEVGKSLEMKKLSIRQLSEETLAQQELDLARAQSVANNPNANDFDRGVASKRADDLTVLIEKRKEYNDLLTKGAALAGDADAAKSLAAYMDPTKMKSFGEEFAGSFDKAGKSVSKFIQTFEKLTAAQKKNSEERGNNAKLYLDGMKTEEEYTKDNADLSFRNTKEQMSGYAAMTSSAASFFDEHSKGYQTLMAVSQVFHAAELAMTMAELVPKAISAVLTQGTGDPYTAFGRMAAMAAIVTGLGVAIGGIGGGGQDTTAKDRQAAQGTGSVMGDASAKSESIAHSIDLVEKNTYQGLVISSSMLASLRNIESNVHGFASHLVGSTDISNPNVGSLNTNNGGATTSVTAASTAFGMSVAGPIGAAIGYAVGKIPLFGKIATSIFGGKQTLSDSGFTLGKTDLGTALSSGVHGMSYADIKTSGGWFSSDKNSTKATALDATANKQFSDIIGSMADAIKQAGLGIGLASGEFTTKLNSFVIDIGNVSLKDLKGDDLQKAIESVFSKLGDDMAKFAVNGIDKFSQIGEGSFETLTRIATEYQTVDVVMQSFGKTFGSVGVGSIEARDKLVQLAGGLDKFTSQAQYLLENFYTDKEQADKLNDRIQPTLSQYGLSTEGENANAEFAKFVTSLDLTTDAGRNAYTVLMDIAPAFKTITDAGKGVFEERKGLQDQLDELTLSSAQLLDKQRNALDDSNRSLFDQVQALKAQRMAIDGSNPFATADTALANLQNSVNKQKASLQSSQRAIDDSFDMQITAQSALADSSRSTANALTGTLQAMKPVVASQQAYFKGAADQLHRIVAAVAGGGAMPDEDSLKSTMSALQSGPDVKAYGNQADYLKDFYKSRSELDRLQKTSVIQQTTAEKALQILKDQKEASDKANEQKIKDLDDLVTSSQDQLAALKDVSTGLLNLAQLLQAFSSAIEMAKSDPVVASNAAIGQAYQTSLGRAPDAEGFKFWQNAAATGTPIDTIVNDISNSTEATLDKLYQSVLGRAPDAFGLKYWMDAFGSSMDQGEIDQWMEAAKPELARGRLPGFAAGIDYLPGDMVAQLHEGERVMPKADNRALISAVRGGNNGNSAMISEFRAMKAEMSLFRVENKAGMVAMQRDTSITANKIKRIEQGGLIIRDTSAA